MSTLIPIEDLGIDWTGSTVIVHGSISATTGGADVQCPCGWRRLLGETPEVTLPSGWDMPESIRAAHEHAATHHGTVHCIIRNALGVILQERAA